MVGFVLWAVLFAGMVVVEGLSLTQKGEGWPSLSDLLRAATRPAWGRWVALAIWLWLGWHMFIRGWLFFLRGSGAEEPPKAPGGGKSAAEILGQVVFPLAVLYGALATMLVAGWRARRSLGLEAWLRRSATAVLTDRPAFVRYTLVTIGASYLLFVAAMGFYQLVIGHPAGGVATSALTGGAFLAFGLELPVFVAVSVVWSLRWRRRHA